MVYSFYDPAYTGTALGTYMILDHIERARAMQLPYVYLGYWVEGSAKMAYKARFKPQEHLGPNGWAMVDAEDYRKPPISRSEGPGARAPEQVDCLPRTPTRS